MGTFLSRLAANIWKKLFLPLLPSDASTTREWLESRLARWRRWNAATRQHATSHPGLARTGAELARR